MTSLRKRIEDLEKRVDAVRHPHTAYKLVWEGPAGDCPLHTPPLTARDVSELLQAATRLGYLSPELEPWQPDKQAYTEGEYLEILAQRRRMTQTLSHDQGQGP